MSSVFDVVTAYEKLNELEGQLSRAEERAEESRSAYRAAVRPLRAKILKREREIRELKASERALKLELCGQLDSSSLRRSWVEQVRALAAALRALKAKHGRQWRTEYPNLELPFGYAMAMRYISLDGAAWGEETSVAKWADRVQREKQQKRDAAEVAIAVREGRQPKLSPIAKKRQIRKQMAEDREQRDGPWLYSFLKKRIGSCVRAGEPVPPAIWDLFAEHCVMPNGKFTAAWIKSAKRELGGDVQHLRETEQVEFVLVSEPREQSESAEDRQRRQQIVHQLCTAMRKAVKVDIEDAGEQHNLEDCLSVAMVRQLYDGLVMPNIIPLTKQVLNATGNRIGDKLANTEPKLWPSVFFDEFRAGNLRLRHQPANLN